MCLLSAAVAVVAKQMSKAIVYLHLSFDGSHAGGVRTPKQNSFI